MGFATFLHHHRASPRALSCVFCSPAGILPAGPSIIIEPVVARTGGQERGQATPMVVTRKYAGEQHKTRSGRQQPRAAPKLPKSKARAHSPTSDPPLPSPPGTEQGGRQREREAEPTSPAGRLTAAMREAAAGFRSAPYHPHTHTPQGHRTLSRHAPRTHRLGTLPPQHASTPCLPACRVTVAPLPHSHVASFVRVKVSARPPWPRRPSMLE